MKPIECWRARRVSFWSPLPPITLTQTFAWRRSGAVSTSVIVTNPIRGSAISFARRTPISWRRSSSTRSVRWLIVLLRPGTAGYRRCRSPARAVLAGDPAAGLLREALDDVALFEVVVPGEADAALEVRGDLAHVVPEAAERVDPVGRHDLPGTPHPGAARPDNPAVGDEAAGDDGALADPEDLPDLGAALDDLHHLRLEHALEGGVDVVRQLVDDVVQPDVDTLGLGTAPGGVRDPGVEPDHDRVRRRGQHDVVVGDVACGREKDVDL